MKVEDAGRDCSKSLPLAFHLLSQLGPNFARCCPKTKPVLNFPVPPANLRTVAVYARILGGLKENTFRDLHKS